jgi:hypothetical protein
MLIKVLILVDVKWCLHELTLRFVPDFSWVIQTLGRTR